jgi:hypothetical protein
MADIQGILCRADRTFYYLDTGAAAVTNSIDRLRGILLRRNLISYHRKDPNDRAPTYKIITLDEAQEKGLDIKCLYLNKHVEEQAKKTQAKKPGNPWSR